MTLPNGTTARYLICSTMACWLMYSAESMANIEVAKFLEFGATATDNTALTDDNATGDVILNLRPAVELKFAGNRFGAVARGEVEYLYFSDAEDDIVDPRLSSKLSGTLIDNLLFFDASLVASRLSTDGNFIRLNDDDTTAVIFKASTFLDRSFGRFADFFLGHTFSTQTNLGDDEDNDGRFESNRNVITFNLERDPQYGGVIWGIGGTYSQDNSDLNEFQNSSVFAKLGATISQTLLTELTFGVERRDFETDNGGVEPEESSVWQLDFNWSPSEFTTLSAGYGERFFGRGPAFELKHRVRNSRIIASFTREVSRSLASLDGISTLGDNPGLTNIANTETVTLTNGNVASQLDEPFVTNQFRLAYKLAGRRSDFIIDAIYSEQERLEDSELDSPDGEDQIDTLLGRLVFDRRLSNFATLRFQYNHQMSKADARPGLNYTENRFGVKFIYHFDGVSEFDDEDIEID